MGPSKTCNGKSTPTGLISALQLGRLVRKESSKCFLAVVREFKPASKSSTSLKTGDACSPAILKVVHAYPDVLPTTSDFKPPFPPQRAVDHRIDLEPGKEPPNRGLYRMSEQELNELKRQLDELLDQGVSPYGAPVLVTIASSKRSLGNIFRCNSHLHVPTHEVYLGIDL